MSEKVVVDRDQMDRIVLMRMDLDRYEAQLIPELYEENRALRNALQRLVAAVQEADQQVSLEASSRHRGALHEAQRRLGECSDLSRNRSAVIP